MSPGDFYHYTSHVIRHISSLVTSTIHAENVSCVSISNFVCISHAKIYLSISHSIKSFILKTVGRPIYFNIFLRISLFYFMKIYIGGTG
jgi:hypothetical protein